MGPQGPKTTVISVTRRGWAPAGDSWGCLLKQTPLYLLNEMIAGGRGGRAPHINEGGRSPPE